MDILIKHEIELHQYHIRQSKLDLARLLHSSFTEVGVSGQHYDFTSILQMMAAESPANTRVHSQQYECIKLAPGVYLLKYQSALVNGLGVVSDFAKRSSIWIFADTRWQLKYHQGTACPPFALKC
ncbi:hypothetical protein PA25_22240 [Pseudoalteromonas sp. A25]|uniref:nuclear transport factor 2 family protein n=1 Tax=Pseudoalteromonas sp. A25 TaxID=116092 RepID=UPI00126098D9|nr:DUF4440 domain-containing protein [Pseudoalteromonas sp. A25]BBN82239.1 hypothetical protein PA25_22240 [Pseudoalteromonas sp. A25]